jgi:hypothetical protein
LTLETTPRDATHWSTRTMARQCGLEPEYDQSDLARLQLAAASKRDVHASPDPLFIDKVRDIVGLYLNPVWSEYSAEPHPVHRPG